MEVVGDARFIAACGEIDEPGRVGERLGLDEAAVATKSRERAAQDKEAARKPKEMEIAGETFEIETIDYVGLLRGGTSAAWRNRPGRMRRTTNSRRSGRPGGTEEGRGKKRKSSHRRPSAEEAQVVGVVGEMHAYRYLRKEFGGRAVQARAWVSETRLKVLPLVGGEPDGTSDGHGLAQGDSRRG